MARNIAAAGLGLRAWNRTRAAAEPLAAVGAAVCDTPAEACRGADVVLTGLAKEKAVADVMDQAHDGLAGHPVWVQTCTVSPDGGAVSRNRRPVSMSRTSRLPFSVPRNRPWPAP
ncbi:NAD(P)-binding domain-containing protein [Streptomyces sp. NPDC001980]|uniref:NAD(P)-binding domain-containing protein n=1 Tax=Streptomyces sp. NPDC001980 TaxID=3157126 RepID=UPI003316E152